MRSFTSALAGAAVATLVVSGSIAIAAIPDSTTKVITGCYLKTSGTLRVIDKQANKTCKTTEIELSWNQQGVKGDIGPQGLVGLTGPAGAKGTNGLNGTNGVDGAPGATGPGGAAGRDGTNGIDGAPGRDGINGASMSCENQLMIHQAVPGFALTPGCVPLPAPTLQENWVYLSAGQDHSCAIRADRTLWCWGNNAFGQLGDGTTSDRSLPVQVGPGTMWATTSTGTWHSCAIRTDGTLWCWGNNFYIQLGDGTTTNRSLPTQVGQNSNWAQLDTGHAHSCATRSDSTLWCWGNNSYGQLGDGTVISRALPVQVGQDSDWAAISTLGSVTSCATRNDGTLWCWGSNQSGELGGPPYNFRLTPFQII